MIKLWFIADISKGPTVISCLLSRSFRAPRLPVLPGFMEGPDDILGVKLGEASEDAAAGDHSVAQPLQTVQHLPGEPNRKYLEKKLKGFKVA